MGLTWMLEIIAFVVSQSTKDGDVPEWVSIFLTIPNVFQGIIIFLVFGIKPSNRDHIKKKYLRKPSCAQTNSSRMIGDSYGHSIKRQNSTPILKKSVSYSPCNDKDAVEFLPSSN